MKKLSFSKSVSTALVAMALVTGLSVPVSAAKVDTTMTQSEVTKSGATVTAGAPTLSLKESLGSGQGIESWTFQYSPVPQPYKETNANGYVSTYDYTLHILVFDKGDRENPIYGRVYTDVLGRKVYSGGQQFSYVDPYAYPDAKNEFTLSRGGLSAGNKEVVAYLFDEAGYEKDYAAAYDAAEKNYEAAYDAWWNAGCVGDAPKRRDYCGEQHINVSKADYMIASAPVAITVDKEASVSTSVTSTSVTLNMEASGATGYEISRKVGTKYQVIATVASEKYTDKGLESKKSYSYKVRPYYVNTDTKKTTYGKYTVVQVTTKGSAMNLQVKVNAKNKVQLQWKKVDGATSYEIYRADTDSNSTKVSKGLYDGYNTYKKIATVKKNKKKYVDKSVAANQSYYYIVRAIIPKSKNVKGDKDFVVEQSVGVSLSFGSVYICNSYTDAKGNKTIEWEKVYGAKGYLVEQYVYTDYQNDKGDWVTYKKLGKNATKIKLPAAVTYKDDGTVVTNKTRYRIRAYSGNKYSDGCETRTYYSLGNVQKVTAKATTNGIQVSWTAVPGAAYYEVYRVKTESVVNNKDIGGYVSQYGAQVTEYVDATTPTQVNVAEWNAAVDASIAQQKADYQAYINSGSTEGFDYSKYLDEDDKLNPNKTYYYQNYSYARDTFDASVTSIVDYVGDLYHGSGSYDVESAAIGADKKATPTKYNISYNPVVEANPEYDTYKVQKSGAQAGVDYTYYVVAVQATAKTAADYKPTWYTPKYFDQDAYDAAVEAWVNNGGNYPISSDYRYEYADDYYTFTNTHVSTYNMAVTGPVTDKSAYAGEAAYVVNTYDYKNEVASTSGVKKYGTATFTTVQKIKKAVTIKSVSSSKGKVTLKFKKKIKGAAYYKVYRATKKKGNYTVAGVTKNAKKLSFTDAGVTKGKTYYYKVVPVVKNEAGAEVEGKASKIKSVKVK